jgi:transglutaminase-like putative cysteine protease
VSWRLRIRHITGFTYAGTAQASYNEARMTPLTEPGQTTLFSQIECAPVTATWRYRDYWGTAVTAFDLQRPHAQLRVTATSLVETDDRDGSDPTIDWGQLRGSGVADGFTEWLTPTPLTRVDEELSLTARDVVGAAGPAAGARAIAEWVGEQVEYQPGSTGVRTSAQEAWQLRKGVCQDIAHLSVGMLRSVGIPARYVSGYLCPSPVGTPGEPDGPDGGRGGSGTVGWTVAGQSHAWVEWWCGGWFAYDPTNSSAADRRHVVVARGRDYTDVTPLKGVYHGAPGTGLGVTVEITRLA